MSGVTEPALAAPLRALLAEEPGTLVAAWLYGSRARGEERPGSDVDLGVLFERPPEPKLGNEAHRLEGRLEAALGLPVQVVVVNTAPPDLVHRVLRDGVLLLDRSARERARFEVKSRNEYFDLQPILARYREARP
jgi:predicted nucleotidyltransferase